MPIYEFECLRCQKPFTLVMHVEEYEHKAVECPECHSKEVEQLVTACQVITRKKS